MNTAFNDPVVAWAKIRAVVTEHLTAIRKYLSTETRRTAPGRQARRKRVWQQEKRNAE